MWNLLNYIRTKMTCTKQLRDTHLPETNHGFEFDLVVVGGGSGGLAAAKHARKAYGVEKVAICDFVTPSPAGSTWGLGGTCVNVGCIPKKLMHQAALQGEFIRHAAEAYGWQLPVEHGSFMADWNKLRQNVNNHIRSLNFGYRSQMLDLGIKYFNARAVFADDSHTLELTDKKGEKSKVTARRIILAMGGRPTLPSDVPGAREHGITSDDLFNLQKDPGTTCVVGASYVALECAGFLRGLGRNVTVLMRSIPLRGYDTEMAERAVEYMEECSGVQFVKGVTPTKVEKLPSGKLEVTYSNSEKGEFDTVLFAIGRTAETKNMNLEVTGAQVAKNGKLLVDPLSDLCKGTKNVYAVGDIVEGGLELTPVAIRAGTLLIDRLYGGSTQSMNYELVPTTVYTPLEYGCVGLSEDLAIERFGKENIVVYHQETTPLEWTVPHLPINKCYLKLVCKAGNEEVLGFHVLGPNAGEITQPVAVALQAGATKAHFDATIGIHPTFAEDLTTLRVVKGSGASASKEGC